FTGERSERLFFLGSGPRGGLLFRPEVRDWRTTVDLSSVQGRARLRLRLLDEKDAPVRVLDKEALARARARAGQEADVRTELAKLEKSLLVTEVQRALVLDSTPPENVAFRKAPLRVVRGQRLALAATGEDPESGIADVLFFLGPAAPGGRVP